MSPRSDNPMQPANEAAGSTRRLSRVVRTERDGDWIRFICIDGTEFSIADEDWDEVVFFRWNPD